jgi:hypothetical protein
MGIMSKIFLMLPAICSVMTLTYHCDVWQQESKTIDTMNNSLLIEQTEIAAWKDLIDAAPISFAEANGPRHQAIGGGMAIIFQKEPIPLFNRVIGLGLTSPLTQQVIDTIKCFYKHHEKYLIHYSSPMQPANADSLMKQNNFYLAGSWERIVRDDKPLQYSANTTDTIEVRLVDESLKERWVKFLIETYVFNFYEWPRAFVLRKRWKHYVALQNDKIIACRSFFLTSKKTIFSGVDAPVPGVMTFNCAPDFAIWRKAIVDGLNEGAVLFVADIELPDKEKNKAAYNGFKQLGFQIPYTRYHYKLKNS